MGTAYLLADLARNAIQQTTQCTPPQSECYQQQLAWRAFQRCLPEELHFSDCYRPREECWDWNGYSVHLDRFPNSGAPVKVIQIHGLGTNGRHLSLIAGGPLWRCGYETLAVDLPGYGMSRLNPNHRLAYGDWVRLLSDLIEVERARDGRRVVLQGFCAGGMLAYHAAQLNRRVAGIIATAFLDPSIPKVRRQTATHWLVGTLGATLASLATAIHLGETELPVSLMLDIHKITNHPDALQALLADPSAAGTSVTARFVASLLNYQAPSEPENFTVCPLLLTQPACDRWTPLHLSERFLDRLLKVKKETVVLAGAGHLPLEAAAITDLQRASQEFLARLPPQR